MFTTDEDKIRDQQLKLNAWFLGHSLGMRVTVDSDFKIFHIDDRLALRLGWHNVHTGLIGNTLSNILCSDIDPDWHHEVATNHIKSGGGPLPLSREDYSKFAMKHRDGTLLPCFINVQTFEDKFCEGMCFNEEGESIRVFGAAEVFILADLPEFVQAALRCTES